MPDLSTNRRTLRFGGTSAVVAATAAPATATSAPSPEFVACQKADRAFKAACDAFEDDAIADPLCDAHSDALMALVEKIDAKAVCTPQDVYELAKAQAVSGYEDGVITEEKWIGDSNCGLEHAIIRAILKMGGADV